jgi:ubiquinone/menaquinone biosynthesis C-methylase UbiE
MSDRKQDAWARVTGKGMYPVEYASMLLNPLRNLICPPPLLIRRMRLRRRDQVLEIGCGPGYFSPAIAKYLTDGTLALFDYQNGMLDIAEERLKKRKLRNYTRRQGDAKALPFADVSFDIAFMVTVLGEVGDVDAALREAARVLKQGGRFSITEIFGDPDFVPRTQLKRHAAAAGLRFEKSFGPGFYYTCNFLKSSPA